ncbi:hypothetical protein C9374_003284 [Naegleria lovaniensis]|uniref:Uncharacterized protein n=1 Tax=Naegleria lovaniensis TaxID=51637 RepID=A0AA88GSS8_NAELO|nr:uncharacterized protein C9374_003284 [Naegleria lovaniensis]KAG2385469.1 hypothetical protein C9374_003284 [Naegleria lovaniensis]
MSQQHTPRLILHFDVNKTIIISDEAAGKTMDDIINQIVMSSIWGYVSETNDSKDFVVLQWKLYSSAKALLENSSLEIPSGKKIINYYDYIEKVLYPYPEHDESVPLEERKRINGRIKEERTKMVKNFTRCKMADDFLDDIARLKKELIRKSSKQQGITLETAKASDYVNIVPAFFEVLLELFKRKRDFQLIIRTYGSLKDISSVIKEINTFCRGEHIDYPLSNEEREFFKNKQIDMDQDHAVGHIYRNDETTCHLIENSLEFKQEMLKFAPIDQMTFSEKEHVISGFENIYKNIIEVSKYGQTRLIRDFYYWWNVNNEKTSAGKIFLVDEKDTSCFQIFFDDNVASNSDFPIKGILDLRNPHSGKTLDQELYLHVHTVQAYAFDFITNRNYYIEKIDRAELLKKKMLNME